VCVNVASTHFSCKRLFPAGKQCRLENFAFCLLYYKARKNPEYEERQKKCHTDDDACLGLLTFCHSPSKLLCSSDGKKCLNFQDPFRNAAAINFPGAELVPIFQIELERQKTDKKHTLMCVLFFAQLSGISLSVFTSRCSPHIFFPGRLKFSGGGFLLFLSAFFLLFIYIC